MLASKKDEQSEPEPAPVAAPEVDDTAIPAEVVAAIGAAIALAQEETSAPAVDPARSNTTGSWLQSGRFREMGARSIGPVQRR